MRVEHVPIPGRELVTIRSDEFAMFADLDVVFQNVKGIIFRVLPPEGATDEEVARAEQRLRAAGAAAVRVGERPKHDVVPQLQHQAPPAAGARDAAMQLVDEAATRDRAALREAVEQALAAGGL